MPFVKYGMEKSILKIIVLYTIIGTLYACLCDFLFAQLDDSSDSILRKIAFVVGYILLLNATVTHLKRRLSYNLTYLQTLGSIVTVAAISIFIYRIYCLAVYRDIEVEYLLSHYPVLLKAILSHVILCALLATRYKTKRPESSHEELQDMFDVNLDK